MTEQQYTDLYMKIAALEAYTRGPTMSAWCRPDVRQHVLERIRTIRDEFYSIKRKEDMEDARRAALRARECPTCD
jgi:hypothetical protein